MDLLNLYQYTGFQPSLSCSVCSSGSNWVRFGVYWAALLILAWVVLESLVLVLALQGHRLSYQTQPAESDIWDCCYGNASVWKITYKFHHGDVYVPVWPQWTVEWGLHPHYAPPHCCLVPVEEDGNQHPLQGHQYQTSESQSPLPLNCPHQFIPELIQVPLTEEDILEMISWEK